MIKFRAVCGEMLGVMSNNAEPARVDAYFVSFDCPADEDNQRPHEWVCRFEVAVGERPSFGDFPDKASAHASKGWTLDWSEEDSLERDRALRVMYDRSGKIPGLKEMAGAAYTFGQLAEEALRSVHYDPLHVDWSALHDGVFGIAIWQHGQAADDVSKVLLAHSPWAVTSDQQEAVLLQCTKAKKVMESLKRIGTPNPGDWAVSILDRKPCPWNPRAELLSYSCCCQGSETVTQLDVPHDEGITLEGLTEWLAKGNRQLADHSHGPSG